MLHLPVSQSITIDPHSSPDTLWLTLDITERSHKTTACSKRHMIPNDTTKGTKFVDKKKGDAGDRKSLSYIFLILSFSMWPFLSVCLCGVMINTAGHGKRLSYNGGGCFGVRDHRLTCLSFPSSPGESLGASGWHSKRPLNHYLLWNHSETAGNGQTDKPGKNVKLRTEQSA